MKKPGEKRVQFAVRVTPEAKKALDDLAYENRVTTAALIRDMLWVAMNHKEELLARLKSF